MANVKISAIPTTVAPASLTTSDFVPISRAGSTNAKVDLSLLVPAAIDLSDAGAGGIKSVTFDPVFPGVGNDAKYSVRVGSAAGGTPDEAINIGYNIGAITAGEPAMGFIQEINYPATARGVAAQRVMESYQQFSNEDTNAPRNFFTAFEPGDTTSVSGETGQILYTYISTGFNRIGTAGGGGLSVGMDFNGSAGGAGGPDTVGYFFVDVDGPLAQNLRSCATIKTLSAATAANPCVITVTSGHGINIGAKIQIFKPNANGWMERDWNAAAAVVGTVTATTATTLTLTGINNTSLGITNGYGWQMARPTATAFAPAFQFLSVGTSSVGSVPFTFTLAGTASIVGSLGIAPPSLVTSLGRDLTSSDYFASPLAFVGASATAGSRRQMITSYMSTPSTGWSIGHPDDATGDDFDNFMFGIGTAQATDSAFTVLKTALTCILFNTNNESMVGIGGVSPYVSSSHLVLAASKSNRASMCILQGTAPSSPIDGQIWREDNTNTGLKVRINGVTKTITVA